MLRGILKALLAAQFLFQMIMKNAQTQMLDFYNVSL